MSAHPCCGVPSRNSSHAIDTAMNPATNPVQTDHSLHPQRPCVTRRIAPGILPAALLILIPKCPACLAAYIALGTGIGLSISTAVHLRMLLIVLCATSLACLVIKWRITRTHCS